jgi:hypothetical protein
MEQSRPYPGRGRGASGELSGPANTEEKMRKDDKNLQVIKALIVDWEGLLRMGWPFSRAETWRRMKKTRRRSSGSRKDGTYKEWIEPNPNPFPPCQKLGDFPNSPPCWKVSAVLAYFETYGLQVSEDWYSA